MNALTARMLRKMGYLSECRGLAERFLSQTEAWNEHLQQIRNFIIRVLEDKKIDNMVVLGSGWLIDIPPEMISQMSRNIYLYDIAHPAQTIHKIRKYGNIRAVTADITGGSVMAAYQAVRKFRKTGIRTEIRDILQPDFQLDVDADFIVSLNVLSQLGILISEYLIRYIAYGEDELNEFNRMIQAAHIRLLKRTPSCLVTDYEEVVTDFRTGQQEVKKTVFADIPTSGHVKRWNWQFDTSGGYYEGKKVILKVIAAELNS